MITLWTHPDGIIFSVGGRQAHGTRVARVEKHFSKKMKKVFDMERPP